MVFCELEELSCNPETRSLSTRTKIIFHLIHLYRSPPADRDGRDLEGPLGSVDRCEEVVRSEEMLPQIAQNVVVAAATVSLWIFAGAHQGKPNSARRNDRSATKEVVEASKTAREPKKTRSLEVIEVSKQKPISRGSSEPQIPRFDHYPRQIRKKKFQIRKSGQRRSFSAEAVEKSPEEAMPKKPEEAKPAELDPKKIEEPKAPEAVVKKSEDSKTPPKKSAPKPHRKPSSRKVDLAEPERTSGSSTSSGQSDDKRKSAKKEKTEVTEEVTTERTIYTQDLGPTTLQEPELPELSAVETNETESMEKEVVALEKKTKDSEQPTEVQSRGSNPTMSKIKKLRREMVRDPLTSNLSNPQKLKSSIPIERKDVGSRFNPVLYPPVQGDAEKLTDKKEREKEKTEFETINAKAQPARPKMKTHKSRQDVVKKPDEGS
uniref:Titin-like n=1 Tax=Steinernema glaseri TaxID=37863 RepID=A0A1I7Z6P9_9BILA